MSEDYVPETIRAAEQSPRRLKYLLTIGHNPNECDGRGKTPLRQAVVYNRPVCVQLLLNRGADAWYSDRFMGGLLAYVDRADIAALLISKLAPMTIKNRSGRGPLFYQLDRRRVLELLLENEADPDQQANNGMTPLMIACRDGKLQAVKILDRRGASWDIRNRWGKTALDYAGATVLKWYRWHYGNCSP